MLIMESRLAVVIDEGNVLWLESQASLLFFGLKFSNKDLWFDIVSAHRTEKTVGRKIMFKSFTSPSSVMPRACL